MTFLIPIKCFLNNLILSVNSKPLWIWIMRRYQRKLWYLLKKNHLALCCCFKCFRTKITICHWLPFFPLSGGHSVSVAPFGYDNHCAYWRPAGRLPENPQPDDHHQCQEADELRRWECQQRALNYTTDLITQTRLDLHNHTLLWNGPSFHLNFIDTFPQDRTLKGCWKERH